MADFFSQFGQIRTPEDYRRAKEAFELDKRMKQEQIANAQMDRDLAKQKMDYQMQNPTSNAPAALQVNAAIDKALKAGDYDTANRIAWLQRSQAYGVDTFGPQGNSPETFQPFKPKEQPAQAGQGIVPDGQQEYVPTGQSIMPRGSIAEQQARNAAMKKQAEKQAERQAEARNELGERTSSMPQLMETVNQLSELGKKATYTLAGQGADWLNRQFGGTPGEGAVARSEYIATVDNQILPLLRQTFGAQFTATEGESLKNTLGDPDKTPEEKDAVLRSFIKQKMMTINTLERESGLPQTQWGEFEKGLGSFYNKPQAAGKPSVGTEKGGYVFLGGDPANPKSWKKR